MLRGYDLDGTLCEKAPKRSKPFFKQTGDERRAFIQETRWHYQNAEKIREPEAPYIIVTGRKEENREITTEWLKSNVTVQPVAIIMLEKSRTRQNMIELKINACLSFGVDVFYEDDMVIANALAHAGINTIKV